MTQLSSRPRFGLFARVWDSPTLTTWASYAARTMNLVLVLPLVLHRFSPAEVALWQVFSTLIGLQLLVDLGFGSTFSRLVSYAMGGVSELRHLISGAGSEPNASPNWVLLERICATMRLIYARLAWLLCGVLLLGGTLALLRRVQALEEPVGSLESLRHQLATIPEAWQAWAIILVSTVLGFRSNGYAAFLQGTNHVALVRRWEALFGLGSIVTSIAALLLGGGLLALVVANQSWVVLSAWRNYRLARQVLGGRFRRFPAAGMDMGIFAVAWTPAWRAGIGAFMSFGLVQISGLIYAQSSDSVAVASYLLGLRLVQTVSQVSQAPFYSKLPLLSRLWAQGRILELVGAAQRGMTFAHWSYVLPFAALGLVGPWLLALIDSQTPFPSIMIWGLLGMAVFLERYGAMHLQLYSTTNHIVWHIANGVTGVIFIGVALLAYPSLGVVSLPLGMLAGNMGFYIGYSARLSYCQFKLPWPWFDLRTAGGPAFCMGAYLLYVYQFQIVIR